MARRIGVAGAAFGAASDSLLAESSSGAEPELSESGCACFGESGEVACAALGALCEASEEAEPEEGAEPADEFCGDDACAAGEVEPGALAAAPEDCAPPFAGGVSLAAGVAGAAVPLGAAGAFPAAAELSEGGAAG